MTKFLIDTNSIVEAKDFFYAFDLCPGFWDALSRHHELGEVYSIDKVKRELIDGNDILVRWAKAMPKDFFLPTATADVATQYAAIVQWVQENYNRQDAVSSFAAKADGWLIAYAKVHGFKIVSEEKLNLGMKKRVANPNVCHQFGVPYCNVFEMLRELNVRFGLEKRSL